MVYCQDSSREMLKPNENNGRHTKKREDGKGSKLKSNVSRDTVGTVRHFPVFASHQSSP